MVIKNIPQIGDLSLRQKAKKLSLVEIRDPKTNRIIKNLIDTMRASNLVGMAAPQIGKSLQIFVTEIRPGNPRVDYTDSLRVFINPKITWLSSKKELMHEGCGSVFYGDLIGFVRRSVACEVEAQDREGKKFVVRDDKLLAQIIQHEYDHLQGVLFTDLVEDNSKLMTVDNFLKWRKRQEVSKNKTLKKESPSA